MGTSTIPLAKPFNPAKLEFPVYVSEKLDGVPIKVTLSHPRKEWLIKIESRQGEELSSTDPIRPVILKWAEGLHKHLTYVLVFEVTHPDFKEFKDVSGVVRRHQPCPELVYNLFDYDASYNDSGISGFGFYTRTTRGHSAVALIDHPNVLYIPQLPCADLASLEAAISAIPEGQEGYVIRSHNAPFKPGKRHWDYQKVVKEPTLDLTVIGYEEGVGKNAGAVGKLTVKYKGGISGVGAGKMTYECRKKLWEEYVSMGFTCTPRIACIKHKPDPSYTGIRQGTFQNWRDDKDEPNEERNDN